jgi:hypothetical protein
MLQFLQLILTETSEHFGKIKHDSQVNAQE